MTKPTTWQKPLRVVGRRSGHGEKHQRPKIVFASPPCCISRCLLLRGSVSRSAGSKSATENLCGAILSTRAAAFHSLPAISFTVLHCVLLRFVLASGAAALRSHTWAHGLPYCVEVALLQTKDILRRSQANIARGKTAFLSVGITSRPALLASPADGAASRGHLSVSDLEVPEQYMRTAMARGVELQFLFRSPASKQLQSVLEIVQNATRCPW